MPEHFKRAIARSREGVDKIQPNQSQTLDLTTLTDQEEKIIQAVIQKDELEKNILNAKISEVKREIQEIRKSGALTNGDDQNTICARCKFKFMPFLLPWVDHGQRCITCKFRVCANCRTRQPNGSWLCILCFKYRQLKLLTGEWISKGQSSNLYGSELLRASLRDRSQTRSGYEEASGGSYIQRPAKVKDDHSDSDSSISSPPSKDQPEELRKEKSSSQRSPNTTSPANLQSFKKKDSLRQPTQENNHLRHVAQSLPLIEAGDNKPMVKHTEGSGTGHPFPKLQLISSTPFADTISSDDVMASLSVDDPLANHGNLTDEMDNAGAGSRIDNNHLNEADLNSSNPVQIVHPHSTDILFPPHKDPRGKRQYLNRNISVSEQNLYYDDVKLTNPNIPRFSSLNSRSISSLNSEYSINPKYRTLKQTSGTSELELFRKRGERYSLKRKKTLENESSVEKNDSKLEIIENKTTINSSENQASKETKPAPIPHWHEILRVQSVVESLTKQNKSPTTTSSPIKRADTSVDYKIFPLMNPRKKMPVRKDFKHLSPDNSRDDSSSSQESISVCVASYMSPTQNLDLGNIFSSTPTECNGSKSKSKSLRRRDLSSRAQISPVSALTLNSTQEEISQGERSPGSNQSKDVMLDSALSGRKNMSQTRHKSIRSYFNIIRSRNWFKLKEPVRDAGGGITEGNKIGISNNERFRLKSASPRSDRLEIPTLSVTNMADEQNVEEDEEEEDDLDELFSNHHPNQSLGSRSSLADSRESIYSIYSDAGEVNYGHIKVTGEIMFDLNYNYKTSTFEVHVIQCKDLAPVDTKHNKSDPYVKTYLMPDKTRSSKRKTRIKKHTLGPVFDEVVKYQISQAELETRSLWVSVWHNDRFGRNDFLGEVTIPLDYYVFDESSPRWYPLQERAVTQESVMSYKGDLFISLKYITPDMAEGSLKKKSGSPRKKSKEKDRTPQSGLGEIHVLIKEAQNLTAMRGSAGSDPFCKGYLLPDVAHASKQKTPVIKKTSNPQWQCILTFEGVDQSQLHQHGLELTIWDYERLSSNDFLGGVRLSLGKNTDQGRTVEWMDSRGEEVEAWQSMIDHPNDWVDAQLPLRVSMGKQSVKK